MDLQVLNLVLIAIGILVGVVGIAFLASNTRRLRTVGVFIFPFMPSIILFAIIFPTSSSASIEYLGKLGGPIAAYVVVVILARRFVEKDLRTEDVEEIKASEAKLKIQLQEITRRYNELREQVETARPKALPYGIDQSYYFSRDRKRKLVILTGSIRNVKNVDVIVNSENTEMLLARIYDTSISGTLRYLDAEKGSDGYVVRDWMAERLQEEIKRKDAKLPVKAGTVFATPTAKLTDQGVKYIFHVAVVKGEVGAGYQPVVEQLDVCIQNCYKQFTDIATKDNIETILFPLLGAGSAKLSPLEAARIMLPQVVQCMVDAPKVKTTYILAWVESHRQALHTIAEEMNLEVANAAP